MGQPLFHVNQPPSLPDFWSPLLCPFTSAPSTLPHFSPALLSSISSFLLFESIVVNLLYLCHDQGQHFLLPKMVQVHCRPSLTYNLCVRDHMGFLRRPREIPHGLLGWFNKGPPRWQASHSVNYAESPFPTPWSCLGYLVMLTALEFSFALDLQVSSFLHQKFSPGDCVFLYIPYHLQEVRQTLHSTSCPAC